MAKPVKRQRKHKVRARASSASRSDGTLDSNAVQILPEARSEREERRQILKAQVHAQQEPSKLSRQKKKRLDKFIDIKLKKEENQALIKKLSKQQVDTSLFKSSKKLGRGDATRREALTEALRSKRAGINNDAADDLLFEKRAGTPSDDGDDDASADGEVSNFPSIPNSSRSEQKESKSSSFGAGLKRPLETDDNGLPIIRQRKRLKARTKNLHAPAADMEEEWEGFSHAGSSNGSATSDSAQLGSGEGDDVTDESSVSEDVASDEDTNSLTDQNTDEQSDDESDRSDEDEDGHDDGGNGGARISNFKAWALSQRNEANGYIPTIAPDLTAALPTRRAAPPQQPIQPTFDVPKSQRPGREAYHVSVTRSGEVENTRASLPVVGKEQEIMETIFSNDCTIVTGATGSGKTTQVPQFLFEAGYGAPDGPTPGLIGVTQPRRVAAVSMAKRVAQELGDHAEKVAHQVRFDTTVKDSTAVKFMTDGILLREVSRDFLLSKYSAIVVDEAHERSVNTDILIGMLSRIVETRAKLSRTDNKYKPLKLIIMSATLRITDFANNTRLFRTGPPPIVEAEGKTYPVTTHFARRTHRDYVEDALRKVGKGHRKLPPGGMLVFLTGQNEIVHMEKRLKDMFQPTEETTKRLKIRVSAAETTVEDEDMDFGASKLGNGEEDSDSDVSVAGVETQTGEQDDLDFDVEPEEARILQKVHVLPLYSQLQSELQMRVFEPPPDGSRMIVLATNVAETSLTIPNIRYVFDCGRAKEKSYEPATGVQSFDVDWISKASAEQRRGRAGRTGPGHCYRLYSSAVYENHFAQHTVPEIMRVPIEGVVLQLKSMGIPNIAHFPFPTPPERSALLKAERLLQNLGALKDDAVTPIGKQLSYYPVSPRLARMLIAAEHLAITTHAIALIAVLSTPEILVSESQLDLKDPDPASNGGTWTQTDANESSRRTARRQAYNAFHAHASRCDAHSDALKLLTVFADWTADPTAAPLRTHARLKALTEAQQLRAQLTALHALHTRHTGTTPRAPPTPLPTPTKAQSRALRIILAAGFADQVAQRADASPTPPAHQPRKPTSATRVPYLPLTPLPTSTQAQAHSASADPAAAERQGFVYVHASSALARLSPASLPRFILYSHLSRAAGASVGGEPGRARMHALAPVEPDALVNAVRGTPLAGESKPIGRIEGLERGARGQERRRVWLVPLLRSEGAGGREWPLPPARRVVQWRDSRGAWVDEEGHEDGAA